MFRRTLLGFVAVMGLLAVGSGTAMADHRSFSGGHHHHHHGGYINQGSRGYGGYGGYRTPNYGYGSSPYVVARPLFVPQYGGCNSGFSGYGYGGYGPAYGGYGYGSPYRTGVTYSSPGFGLYIGR